MSRPLIFMFAATVLIAALPARSSSLSKNASPKSPLQSRSARRDLPLSIFQSIDKRLTGIDADGQRLAVERKGISGLKGMQRKKRLLQQLQHSAAARDRLSAVNQLSAITSRAKRIYSARRQRYGAGLFRELGTKAAAVRKSMLRAQNATTAAEFDRQQSLVDAHVLSLITQFQAVSGGYASLACRPGTWACCEPRSVQDGTNRVSGCTWTCAATLNACRGGCLGPRTPATVVAVKNGAVDSRSTQHTMRLRKIAHRPSRGKVAVRRGSLRAKVEGAPSAGR